MDLPTTIPVIKLSVLIILSFPENITKKHVVCMHISINNIKNLPKDKDHVNSDSSYNSSCRS